MNKMLEYELVSRMLKEIWIARNHQLFNAMSLCHREKWTGSSSDIQKHVQVKEKLKMRHHS
jgi:hypothetical protein